MTIDRERFEIVLMNGGLGVFNDDSGVPFVEWDCASEDQAGTVLAREGLRRVSAWKRDGGSLHADAERIV